MPNSHAIKLVGKFEISQPLNIDHNYTIALTADITSIAKHSQENGEFEYIYTAKAITGEATDGKAVIKLPQKGRQSVLLRGQLAVIATDRDLDPETFYNATMGSLRHNMVAVLDLIESLDK